MNTPNNRLDNKYVFTAETIHSIPSEIKARIITLYQINKDLNFKKNVTESFFQFSAKKKAELKQKLKEADEDLQSLEKQIETYYNYLFSDMKLEKNKSMSANLTLLREMLDNKNAALKSRKVILAEREIELDKKLKVLDKSKLELFNQMMAKIEKDKDGSYDNCLLCDTNSIKFDYEKLKNGKINQLANELTDSFNLKSAKTNQGKKKEKQSKRPKSVEVSQILNDNSNNKRDKGMIRNSSITHHDTTNTSKNKKTLSPHKMQSIHSSNKATGKFHSKMFSKG